MDTESSDEMDYHREAFHLANFAVHFDTTNNFEAAIFYYLEASKCLKIAQSSGVNGIENKITEYENRAKQITDKLENASRNVTVHSKNECSSSLNRAEFLMKEALDEDESGNDGDAIDLYTQAIELCLKSKEETNDDALKRKLTQLATNALDRAESLKSRSESRLAKDSVSSDVQKGMENLKLIPSEPKHDDATNFYISEGTSQTVNTGLVVSGQSSYTKEEIAVLRYTSVINGREYVPFLSVDLKERFSYSMPYSDRDGLLVLSQKQKSNFSQWSRLEDICPNPKVICDINCFHIKQTIVSDCSFVASLAVSALYEKRFKKKLITKIIYPQNRSGPCYNPCGKYMIKLNINGITRKVIIDDYLPVGRNGELLCSYSQTTNEFWISLLEKAYMKVMGGYDFPGSNSNIDLHALTQWIPERISLSAPNFERDKLFNLLLDRHNKGDVLITFATGELSDAESDRTGLVPTHAYAMLDIRRVNGKELFLLKNPWSHMRWKGKYSERDLVNWTSSMRSALNYDPNSAKNFDNGVFWIDMDSVFHFYDVAYLNWNPSIFKYTYCTHSTWNAGVGPVKDLYNIGENPQYSLVLKSAESSVWILLTRHITDRNDFANNREYIALLVYKNNAEKVYLPFDPPPYIDGVRINSPHYLCKIIPKDGCVRYTLVISQYEKSNTINYTLRAYATCPFVMKKIENVYKFKETEKSGKWTQETAGGCLNYPDTYSRNPVYQLSVNGANEQENELLIDLKGPKDYAIGIDIVTINLVNQNSQYHFPKAHSGAFRSGYTILKLKNVPAGTYNIIPSTFKPNQTGPFFLTVQSTCTIKLSKLR